MKRANCVVDRACPWLAPRAGAWIIGLAVVWMAASPRPAWGQSAVWQPQGATTGNIYYNGGNVGIGTASPSAKLSVSGDVSATGSLTVQQTINLVNPAVDGNSTVLLGEGGVTTMHLFYSGTNNQFIIRDQVGGNDIVRFNRAVGNYNAIFPTGSVGIGTTNPQYKLAVNGTIGAKDVIVTNTGWPDYVFRPGYRLRPLSEVGAYIRTHRHLPDIPTEAEVKEKGVSVGDMQAKLLAKVEELTLHMIQADERSNQMEKQNRELRERVAQLESRLTVGAAPAAGR